MELRDYQESLVAGVMDSLAKGLKPAAFGPTGSGKSVCIAEVVRQLEQQGDRILVGCHRREILLHLEASLEAHTGVKPAVISAESKTDMAKIDEQVIITMIPTISRRKRSIPDQWIGRLTMILDECHHSTAPTWSGLIDHLRPKALAGFSATLASCNQRPLGEIFTNVIQGPSIQELITRGFLAKPILFAAEDSRSVSTQGVRTRGGDYVLSDLSDNAVRVAGETVEVWKALNPDRRLTLVACCSVVHAQEVADKFNEEGVIASVVHGEMSTPERDSIINRFSKGEINVLTFVSLIDEGMDIPAAGCLVWARPTKSIRLWNQLNGRVERIAPGKTDCLIIDQTSNWRRLPLPNEHIDWDLTLPAEEGARPEKRDTKRKELVRDEESNVIELRDITPSRFAEIKMADIPLDSRSTLLQEQLRLMDPAEFMSHCAQMDEWTRRHPLRSFTCSPTATLEDFNRVGEAFGFSRQWGRRSFIKSVERNGHGKGSREHAKASAELNRALDEAIAAGELGPRIREPGMARFVGQRLGTIVIEFEEGAVERQHRAAARDKVCKALEPRIAPYGLLVLGLEAALTWKERHLVAVLDAFDAA